MSYINRLACIFGLFLLSSVSAIASPGDTVVVKTIRFDTNLRSGIFQFPGDAPSHWEKISMLYKMRCKDGQVSTQASPNLGCGEWDYNCYTYIIDSSQVDSLISLSPSHSISGFSGSNFIFTTQPQSVYTMSYQQAVNYTSVINETVSTVGNGNISLNKPFGTVNTSSRSQYLFTASELSSAGLISGDINGLRLNIVAFGSTINNLRVNIKTTSQLQLDPDKPETTGFLNVFYLGTTFNSPGEQSFNFHTPFSWDGISNLIVEFTYSNPSSGNNSIVLAHNAGFNAGMHATGPDHYLRFDGGVQALKVNNDIYNMISDQITIAFWSFGDSLKLPANTTALEAIDSLNHRQVNVHLPWSNSRVYWDCGGDAGGGYDRVEEAANADDFEGRWNHWAFTKNANTGEMKIWLNGSLFASGTNKTKLIDISNFIFGAGLTGSLYYYGGMDDISIWNISLDSSAISDIMFKDITTSHPFYSNLLVWYKLNEGNGNTVLDASPNGFDSQLINPAWWSHRGHELGRNFNISSERPNTSFIQGTYVSNIQQVAVIDSLPKPASSVITYTVQNNNLLIVDTVYAWQAGYYYIYDPQNIVWDSIYVNPEDSIQPSTLTWYQRRPMRLELINFITPYGKGLNMNGLSGKTWVFDVTDYAPSLRGPVFLGMGDGIYQEDNEITFVFYEGTSPRTARSIQQIWPNGTWVSPSYNEIYNDKYFEPRMLTMDPGASMYKIRSAISGHGQEGEFIPRYHTISVNDTVSFTRKVWKACASNPIYPQGGTWVYDRAGWCPGADVDLAEFEITALVSPGSVAELDYSLPYNMNPGSSNYRVNNQLVSYGPPNLPVDAAIDYIKQPTSRTEFARLNPLCNAPVVRIKNTGSSALTSLVVTYGRTGGDMSVYNWAGQLDFLETTEITLPAPDWQSSQQNNFIAYISMPNGNADIYNWNDTLTSDFNPPPIYPNQLIFELKTNYRASENRYIVTNSAGDTVLYRDFLNDNTVYRDTLDLAADCYTLFLTDDGDDGLSFWANTGAGSGYFRIKGDTGNIIYKSFNPDFGNNIYHQFTTGYALPVPEISKGDIDLKIHPNPAGDYLQFEYSARPGSKADIILINIAGQAVLQQEVQSQEGKEHLLLDLSNLQNGIYFLILKSGGQRISRKVIVTE